MIPAFQNKMSVRVSDLHVTKKIKRVGKKFKMIRLGLGLWMLYKLQEHD